jgi:cellulose synthase/poly-beta-1,6-N-acetylglucosamine synthase-like glycosyltransferase
MTGHCEGERILEKLRELLQQLNEAHVIGQVIVVLDGIGGGPNEAIRSALLATGDARVQVVALPSHCGKAAAIAEGVRIATNEILVFADVRQVWQESALSNLLENFRDPTVGAVSGELVLLEAAGPTRGVGFYWKFEKWLRLQEARLDTVIGVTGAICAVRRELFTPPPAGTILDDVYWPLNVIIKGYRVLHDPRAVAFDRLPSHARDELKRKVRTLCGNFQLVFQLPAALSPTRNRAWWQFVSHKLLRLVVPWALLGAIVLSATIPTNPYHWLFLGQASAYGLTVLGMLTGLAYRFRIGSAAAAFLMLNYAAWIAFWMWLLKREDIQWVSLNYDNQPTD